MVVARGRVLLYRPSLMHYLITGGCGFIGSHLASELLASGDRVTVIDDLSTGRISNIERVKNDPNFRIIIGSVLERELLEPVIRDVDAIFHLASAVGVRLIMEQPVRTIETIFQGTDAVLKFAARYHRKVLITSTSEVYGKSENIPFREDGDRVEGPTTMHRWAYACAKALDEFLALAQHKTSGLPVVVCRLFNTVGPRQSAQYGMVIPRFVEAALQNQPLLVYGDGLQTRCFAHVKDVVQALQALVTSARAVGQVYNVGTTEEIAILQLAKEIIQHTGSRSEVTMIPYSRAFPDGGFEDMRRRVPCLDKIATDVGWSPQRALREIVADVVAEKRTALQLVG